MFYAVYETDTGRLRSTGTVVADPLPEGLGVRQYAARPEGFDWNTETLEFDIPRTVPPPILTPAEFMNLFTLEEDVALEAAAQNDAMLRVFLRRVQSNPTIRMDNELVAQGLGYLTQLGILTPERAAEIGGA